MADKTIGYSPTRRRLLRDATFTSLGLIAAACAPGTSGTTTGTTTGGGTSAKGGEFHGGWPFKLAPEFHYNYFATNSLLGDAIYRDHHEVMENFRGREVRTAAAEAFVLLPSPHAAQRLPGV